MAQIVNRFPVNRWNGFRARSLTVNVLISELGVITLEYAPIDLGQTGSLQLGGQTLQLGGQTLYL